MCHTNLKPTLFTSLGTLVLAMVFAVPAFAQQPVADRDTMLTGAQWDAFNKSIIDAVHSDNRGVREGGLVQICQYGDYMSFPELTVFQVMHIYRDDPDPRIKRLAVVALGNMGSKWAIEFLDMLSEYEDNESLRKTIDSVVREAKAGE